LLDIFQESSQKHKVAGRIIILVNIWAKSKIVLTESF